MELLDPDTIIKLLVEARGFQNASTLTPAGKQIIKNLADTIEQQISIVTTSQKLEAERAINLESLESSFADSSKEELLGHLNKITEAFGVIVRAAIRVEGARAETDKMINSDEEISHDDIEAQENKEADLTTQLIEEIKALHNSAPEESGNEVDPVTGEEDQGEDVRDVTATEDLNSDDAPVDGDDQAQAQQKIEDEVN